MMWSNTQGSESLRFTHWEMKCLNLEDKIDRSWRCDGDGDGDGRRVEVLGG